MAIMNRPNLPTSSSEHGSIAGYSRNLLAHPTGGISGSRFLSELLGWNPIGPRFRPQDCTALQLHHISALGRIMPQTPSLPLLSGRTKCLVPSPKPMTLLGGRLQQRGNQQCVAASNSICLDSHYDNRQHIATPSVILASQVFPHPRHVSPHFFAIYFNDPSSPAFPKSKALAR